MTPIKKPRKHRICEETLLQKQELSKARQSVVRALRKVKAQQRAEAKATAKLLDKANRLTVEHVVAIVDMKTEIPDIVCRHCSCGIKTGPELRKALRDTLNGLRQRHSNAPGKALQDDS